MQLPSRTMWLALDCATHLGKCVVNLGVFMIFCVSGPAPTKLERLHFDDVINFGRSNAGGSHFPWTETIYSRSSSTLKSGPSSISTSLLQQLAEKLGDYRQTHFERYDGLRRKNS